MKIVRVSVATPLSRRVGGRASSLVSLALAGALWLSLPALAAYPAGMLRTVDPNALPGNGRVAFGRATIGLPNDPANQMTITQHDQQVIIDWDTFDIGSDAWVRFLQPGPTAEALNRIYDANPSVIMGRLTANGRIYLINSNGILFGKGAQVDTRGLIASSLAMSQTVFEEGAFNRRDASTPALEGKLVSVDANGNAVIETTTVPTGAVVNQGTIRSVDPDDGSSPGGYIILVAPEVHNEGLIVADNGQVVLAAGAKAWLTPNAVGDNLDITMRGMLVEIQAGLEPLNVSALVSNSGTLRADRGNVSMVGLTVNQSGNIRAGTAVNQNGSVWLLAREKQGLAGQRFGKLTLEGKKTDSDGNVVSEGSRIETPLIDDGTTLTESQSYEDYRARVKLDGETVAVDGSIVAHGGIVEIGQSSASPGAALTTSRVLIESTASIDVSGSTAELDMAKNFVTFTVTTDDLKDAPIQKNGFLLKKSVTVDLRKGSPELFDISAAAAGVKRGIKEKAATGGDVKIAATEVIAKQGAAIDVSGGEWVFSGTDLTATQLSSGNQVYDIHTASADLTYDGIVGSTVSVEHAKWGITRDYDSAILARTTGTAGRGYSYVEGRDAGSVTIDAAYFSLGSDTLRGGVTMGQTQRSAGEAPTGAKLVLGDLAAFTANPASPRFRLGGVTFGTGGGSLPADFDIDEPLPEASAGTSWIAPDIFGSGSTGADGNYRQNGFSDVEVYSGGKVEVARGAAIDAPAGSALTVYAHEVAVNDDIRLSSGSVSLHALNTDGSSGEANLAVAGGKTISASGQWVNDASGAPASGQAPLGLDGGRIDLSGYNIELGAGSLLDVSAGAQLNPNLKLTAGKAGSISLSASPSGAATRLADLGRLDLRGTLRGYGVNGGAGGNLTLKAASATIGGTARNDRDLVLDPSFFRQGGFTKYSINGVFDTEVAAGTTLRPVAETRVVDTVQGRTQATGADPGHFSATTLLPAYERRATDLSLSSSFKPTTAGESAPADVGAPGGLRIAAGSLIETDPGATVSLASNSRLDVDGTISAPGGTIKLSLKTESAYGGETLRIGSGAKLIAAGTFLPQPNVDGWLKGELLRGGSVKFDVSKNDLVVEDGALVDVSGASALMDISTGSSTLYTRQTVGSEGGSVEINATENVTLDGTFKAEGGAGAAGGNFSLEQRFHQDSMPETDPRLGNQRHVIAVTQTQDETVAQEDGVLKAKVSADMLKGAGFGKVTLSAEDAIEFQGNVDLAMKRGLVLDAPEIAARDGATVTLAAGQVALQNTPDPYRPSAGFAGVATRTGTGALQVDGALVELAGHVTLNGFAETNIASTGDLRANASSSVALNTAPIADNVTDTERRLTGSLTTPGDLTLKAAQVYPATAVDYTVRVANVATDGTATTAVGRTLKIEGNGNAPATVLSASGKLRFEADRIVHDGVVKAPLGALEFVAASKLLVTDRSITSVAANGLTMPFGITSDGKTLYYGAVDRTATPPEKRILFEAPDEEIAPEAQVDIGGGGELQALEWVPGLGGSKDILLADNTWAIVPGLRFASRDAMLEGLKSLGFDARSAIYDSIYLAAGSGLPAGYYPLLPGYYALLPGAYVVTQPAAAAAMTNLPAGRTVLLANGQQVVAGRFASAASGETEAGWSGFVVRNGTEVLKEAEYRISDSSFYADAAAAAERAVPQLPADVGRIAFVATNALALGGVLKSLPANGGRIGEVDIAAPNLAVVAQAGAGTAPAGFVEIEADRISAFNASVMLGGTRSAHANGTALDVVSSEVRMMNDADHAVTTPEVIVAARDRVEVATGAVVEATGSSATTGRNLIIADASDDGGALLRLSAGAPVQVLRGARRGANRGELEIAAGSVLRTARSILLDATTTTRALGTLDIAAGGAASFSAQKVSLGETPVDADGLVMDRAQLEALAGLGELTLKSYTNIDLYGDATFGNRDRGSLTLDAAGIVGHAVDGRNDASLAAQTLVVQNTGTATTAPTTGSGSLTLAGQSVTIGAGEKSISGYDQVKVAATGDLTVVGQGSLKASGDLTLEAARITAQGKSNQTIQAGDSTIGWRDVLVTRPADAAAVAAQAAAGGHLEIIGKRVEQGGTIDMPSGVLTLAARGSDAGDDVILTDGSQIVASGYARNFAGTTIAASGGTVTLSSDHGSVDMQAGASLDVSGTSGGDAGELVVSAAEGQAHLDGTLSGGATGGGDTGSVTLDVGSLANFKELNKALYDGGFRNEYSARARNGDVSIAAGDTVVARDFALVADNGSIDVAGTIDASGPEGGGRIALTAKDDLNLRAGSVLDARGTSTATGSADAYSHGGEVEVTAIDGTLDFAEGASIDVSAHAAGKSNGGEILFSAGRSVRADGTPGVNMSLAGNVNVSGPGAAGSVIVEGRKTYTGVTDTAAYVTPDASNRVWNDYQAYMSNIAAIRGDLALKNADGTAAFDPAAVRVRAAIELQNDDVLNNGDMAHTAGWNLAQGDWRLGDEPGRLTLRAAGNLSISNYLGFSNDTLPTGETWSLQLVGGADLSSANALATVASTERGDVTLADTKARVTSGTGDIDIAAGRDFTIADIANTRAAVYTAGAPVITDTVFGQSLNRFAADGGDLSIVAGRHVNSVSSPVPVNDWLRRYTGGIAVGADGRWWVHRPTFRQAVGVLGGGELAVKAGGDVKHLTAVVPTAGRVVKDAEGNSQLLVTGGGNLAVDAGGDVIGGNYLIGRGSGEIRTGGDFGAGTATALYLMGESEDEALHHASFEVEALADASLRTASNPTIQALTRPTRPAGDTVSQGFGTGNGHSFFTYAPDASVDVVAVAGDVTPIADGLDSLARVYPASVTMAALQGSIVGAVPLTTSAARISWLPFPSTSGGVRLLAADSVSDQWVIFGDAVPASLPFWSQPIASMSANVNPGQVWAGLLSPARSRLVLPQADSAYRYQVAAVEGDISESKFEFPGKSSLRAGGDIVNVALDAQNLSDEDVTTVRAGGEIRYTSLTAGGEKVDPTLHFLRISGPGRFLVQAGGDIDFGLAAGIFAVGDATNLSLTSGKSAAITALAGVTMDVAQTDLDALFAKLRETGTANDPAAGDAAIAAVFGAPDAGSGDIRMVYSGIQTQGNSSIQVLAPHGRIDVGLPTALADTTRQIGIVTAAGGSIDVLVRDDILVNLSKIITMLGGDITIYSQFGGIDAGRGPRDSVSSLGAKVVALNTINSKGQSVDSGLRRFQPPIDSAGSGMRTNSFDPDGPGGPIQKPRPGDINLFAPRGYIDAGEAGVNAVGNITLVTPEVRNADMVVAGGSSSGVPVSDAGSLAGVLSAASGSTAGTNKAMENVGGQAGAPMESFKPSFINVEVLGFGE